jgi:hypothetical protein
VLQSAHLRILARQLTAEGCAPARPSAATAAKLRKRGKASGGGSSDEGSGDESSDASDDDAAGAGLRRSGSASARKLRGKLRERVLEEWGSWRYVVESGPHSGKLLEEVCEVEVGRWAESNAR